MTSYRELRVRLLQLDTEIAAARAAERSAALATIRQLMSQFDITGAELDERLGAQRVPGSAVIPRYRDPASGATWTGRGRRPRWFDAQEAERFRIKSPATEPSVGQDT